MRGEQVKREGGREQAREQASKEDWGGGYHMLLSNQTRRRKRKKSREMDARKITQARFLEPHKRVQNTVSPPPALATPSPPLLLCSCYAQHTWTIRENGVLSLFLLWLCSFFLSFFFLRLLLPVVVLSNACAGIVNVFMRRRKRKSRKHLRWDRP